MLAVVQRDDLPRHAARLVADDEGVDAHRRDGLDRVAQALALVDARRPDRERHHVGRQALGRRLERQPGAGRVLEEHVAHGAAAQRRHLRVGSGIDLDHVLGEIEQPVHGVDADLGDRAQVLHRSSYSVVRRSDFLIEARRQVLADVVGADRQLAMATVDEHGELHGTAAGRSRRGHRGRPAPCDR